MQVYKNPNFDRYSYRRIGVDMYILYSAAAVSMFRCVQRRSDWACKQLYGW